MLIDTGKYDIDNLIAQGLTTEQIKERMVELVVIGSDFNEFINITAQKFQELVAKQ